MQLIRQNGEVVSAQKSTAPKVRKADYDTIQVIINDTPVKLWYYIHIVAGYRFLWNDVWYYAPFVKPYRGHIPQDTNIDADIERDEKMTVKPRKGTTW